MENTKDMIKKDRMRQARGEGHGNTKLSWAEVCEIRKRPGAAQLGTQKKLAVEFNVCRGTIASVVDGKSWKKRS